MASEAFERYVDEARKGRTGLWRIVIGTILIAVFYVAFSIAAVIAILMGSGAFTRRTAARELVEAYFMTPQALTILMGSFVGLVLGVALVVRVLHKRKTSSVLGPGGRFSWANFGRSGLVILALTAIGFGIAVLSGFRPERSSITVAEWLIRLVPFGLLIFLQTAAEELTFRGYLLQSLAARYRSWLVWAVIPAVLFSLLHWNPGLNAWGNLAGMFDVACFATVATLLVYRTGDLGAAMGLHFANNAFVILIASQQKLLSGAALFAGPFMDGGDWTAGDTMLSMVMSLASTALTLWLLTRRRSPFSVKPRSLDQDRPDNRMPTAPHSADLPAA